MESRNYAGLASPSVGSECGGLETEPQITRVLSDRESRGWLVSFVATIASIRRSLHDKESSGKVELPSFRCRAQVDDVESSTRRRESKVKLLMSRSGLLA